MPAFTMRNRSGGSKKSIEPSLQFSGAKNTAEVHQLRPPVQSVTFKVHQTQEKSPSASCGKTKSLKMLVLKDMRGCLNRCGDGTGQKASEKTQEFYENEP